MSTVRSLVFEYTTSGASEAVRKDRQVRQSVRRTGKQANRHAGSVKRWAERNRDSIRMMSTAMLGFAAGIASASPTLRSNLGAIRMAVSLIADRIVRDLLPSGNSLASLVIDLARRFTNLNDTVRTWISRFAAVATLFSVVALVAGPVISALSTISSVLATLVGVVGPVITAIQLLVGALGTLLGVSSAVAAGLVALVGAAVALAAAFIFNFRNIRNKTIKFLTQLLVGARERLLALLSIARETSARARESVVNAFRRLVDGVLSTLARLRDAAARLMRAVADQIISALRRAQLLGLFIVDRLRSGILGALDLARQLGLQARGWVSAMVSGVRDRAGDLVSAFRSMASRVATAFRARFNSLIPSSISIPSVTINIPSILGGGSRTIGGGSLRLPQLDTGGRIVSDGLAMLHAGERIMPAAQVRERGPQPTGDSGTTIEEVNITVQAMGEDPVATGRGIAREFERELSDRGA